MVIVDHFLPPCDKDIISHRTFQDLCSLALYMSSLTTSRGASTKSRLELSTSAWWESGGRQKHTSRVDLSHVNSITGVSLSHFAKRESDSALVGPQHTQSHKIYHIDVGEGTSEAGKLVANSSCDVLKVTLRCSDSDDLRMEVSDVIHRSIRPLFTSGEGVHLRTYWFLIESSECT
eukprot:533678-Amphidinium_carterae.1